MNKVFTFIILLFLSINSLTASDTDSTIVRKNIIRWNPTPMFVVGPKSFVFGYERVLNNNQSISINIGYLEKSALTNEYGDPLEIFDQSSKGGFDFSLDYRFYFKKRNKYPAPDGLYWGPYTSVYQIWQDASVHILEKGNIKNTAYYSGSFGMYNVGLQLGYQFIIKKRFSIDLILMGPSYSYYNLDLNLQFETDIHPDDPFYQEMIEKIGNSSPLLEELMKNQSLEASGRLKFSYYGFRYGIQLGYHF